MIAVAVVLGAGAPLTMAGDTVAVVPRPREASWFELPDTLPPRAPWPLPTTPPPPPSVAAPGETIRGLVYRRPAAGPVVALTFDDGYSVTTLRELLAVAAHHKIPITLFPIGNALFLAPNIYRAAAAAGVPIANHTRSHPFLTRLQARRGSEAVIAEIRGFAAVADSLQIPYVSIFRPPYGDRHRGTDLLAARAGFPTVATWDTSFVDTAPACVGSIAGRIRHASRGEAGSIVLGHINTPLTPRIMAEVAARYRARGLTLVTLPTLLTGAPERIDWAAIAAAASLPARDGDPAVPTKVPEPYDPRDRRPPGALLGGC